jgi:hypothetical protein
MSAEGASRSEIADYLNVSAQTVGKYLDASACPECGGPVISVRAKLCAGCATQRAVLPVWSRDEIVEALLEWAEQEGCSPTSEEWYPREDSSRRWAREYPGWPSSLQVVWQFGSWSAALEAAGLDPLARAKVRGPRSRWDRESIVRVICDFAQARGRPPKRVDWRQSGGEHPTVSIVSLRFGSWGQALRAAGFTPNRILWDREEILSAMREHSRRHGSPPTKTQWQHRDPEGRWPAAVTVIRCFGSWATALMDAGLRLSYQAARPTWTRESMLDALHGFAAAHGRPPGTDELRLAHGLPSEGTLARHFGSLAAAFAAASLGAPRRSDRPAAREWDRVEVLEAIATFARKHGRPPTYVQWQRGTSEHPAGATVRRLFGSWSEGLIAAGVAEPAPTWDRQSIIEAIRAWAKKHGRAPTQEDWHASDPAGQRPIYATVVRHYGSWPAALEAAGVLPARLRRWSREEVIEAMQAFTHKHGRAPTTADWHAKSHEHPGPDAARRWFGSWNDALIAAGVRTPKPVWNEQRILLAIQAWTATHGAAPTQKDWKATDPAGQWPSYEMVVRHCGSWPAALHTALYAR